MAGGGAFTKGGRCTRRKNGGGHIGRKSSGDLPFWRFFKLVKVCRREPSSGAKGCRLTVAIATVVDGVVLSLVWVGGRQHKVESRKVADRLPD